MNPREITVSGSCHVPDAAVSKSHGPQYSRTKPGHLNGNQMIDFTFDLNGEPMSFLKYGALSFPAFSGLGAYANRREYACHVGVGPIPPGTYYVLDRQSGGLLGPFRDMFSDRGEWFALYAIDGMIDDTTYCNKVKRGSFRLHPKGPLGISEGCITVESQGDFQCLRSLLKGSAQVAIPRTNLNAYGKVVVR